MSLSQFSFFADDIDFTLPSENVVKQWLLQIISEHKKDIEEINIIFCSDRRLLFLNEKHLNHSYLTDILTFPYHHSSFPLIADIFISIERVRENALLYGCSFSDELHRVMIHGILHLLGYNDETEEEKSMMRMIENDALKKRLFV